MKTKIGIKDIAKFAGVSHGTVDRVLHNRGSVSAEAKKKIDEAIKELNYTPNRLASILASNKYYRFATFLPDPKEDEFWEHPDKGIKEAIKVISDYHCEVNVFYFKDGNPTYFLDQAKKILANNYDGFLFSPSFTKQSKTVLDLCIEHQTPFVEINTKMPINDPCFISYIGQDSYGSGVLGGKLLNFGLNSQEAAAIIHLEKEIFNNQHLVDKETGFRDYFKGKNIKVVQGQFGDIYNEAEMLKFFAKFFADNPTLKGLFISTSRVDFLIPILEKLDLLDELKIVGFDLKDSNLKLLLNEKVDFLINQGPFVQGYQGLMTLFNKIVLKKKIDENQLLPIDVVVKENYTYYLDKAVLPTLV